MTEVSEIRGCAETSLSEWSLYWVSLFYTGRGNSRRMAFRSPSAIPDNATRKSISRSRALVLSCHHSWKQIFRPCAPRVHRAGNRGYIVRLWPQTIPLLLSGNRIVASSGREDVDRAREGFRSDALSAQDKVTSRYALHPPFPSPFSGFLASIAHLCACSPSMCIAPHLSAF